MKLRDAQDFDFPPLYALIEDYQEIALDDYDARITPQRVQEIFSTGVVFVFDLHGYAVGGIWFDEFVDDLHCTAHIMVRPRHLKSVLRNDLIGQALDRVFEAGIKKIKAEPMETQQTGIKLLKRYRFKHTGISRNETRQNGKMIDVIRYELHGKFRKKWKKLNG